MKKVGCWGQWDTRGEREYDGSTSRGYDGGVPS